MKPDLENTRELAALHALGALEGEEAREFSALLAEEPGAGQEAQAFGKVAEALAAALPPGPGPSPELKGRILRAAEQLSARQKLEAGLATLAPRPIAGFASLHDATGPGWLPLPIPGAFVKLLSFDPKSDYATVLGKLEAGARYPRHAHVHPEDVFMISGDLHIGTDTVLRAGDFHHAEAGTSHDVNWSEQGCVLLAVLSKEDLLNQFVAA